jgi:hypothetical protein
MAPVRIKMAHVNAYSDDLQNVTGFSEITNIGGKLHCSSEHQTLS